MSARIRNLVMGNIKIAGEIYNILYDTPLKIPDKAFIDKDENNCISSYRDYTYESMIENNKLYLTKIQFSKYESAYDGKDEIAKKILPEMPPSLDEGKYTKIEVEKRELTRTRLHVHALKRIWSKNLIYEIFGVYKLFLKEQNSDIKLLLDEESIILNDTFKGTRGVRLIDMKLKILSFKDGEIISSCEKNEYTTRRVLKNYITD